LFRFSSIAFVCAAIGFHAPGFGQAQSQPEAAPAEIVVRGGGFEEQVRDFVGALTPAHSSETISRFESGVCPAVRGLTAAQNGIVTARLRAVASAAGIRVEREACRPNALVVVTADKRAFISALSAQRPGFFGGMTGREIRRLASAPGPSAAWQLRGLVNADGHPIEFDAAAGIPINRTTTRSSRARPDARWVFEGTALVVERAALDGLNTTQLADFAAMRLFARTDPSRLAAGNAATILTILETPMGSPVPLTLTEWDLAFLRGLYASPENLFAAAQRSLIVREMREGLQERPERD
jgi:hypothetical protein